MKLFKRKCKHQDSRIVEDIPITGWAPKKADGVTVKSRILCSKMKCRDCQGVFIIKVKETKPLFEKA